MKRMCFAAWLSLLSLEMNAAMVFNQPPDPGGKLMAFQSSQLSYDWQGNDYDQYVWDNFTLSSTQSITEVRWRGVYTFGGYWGGPVVDFVVSIWASAGVGGAPDVLNPPLVQYTVGSNAGENPPQPPGAVAQSFHDYRFVLPTPFQAAAGVKYWVQTEGIQVGPTDWSIAGASGGNCDNVAFGSHINYAGGWQYWYLSTTTGSAGDAAFSLLTADVPPGIPTGLGAIAGNGLVLLSWSAPTNATSYNIKRSLTSGGPYNVIGSSITTNYTDTTVAMDTLYYYVVSALNGSTEGSNSVEVSALPYSPPIANLDYYMQVVGTALKIPIANMLANDFDLDGDPITFNSVSLTTLNGLALTNDATYVYVPTNSVADSFTYTIKCNTGEIGTGTVYLFMWASTAGQMLSFSVDTNKMATATFWCVPWYQYEIQRGTNVQFVGALRLWTTNAPVDGMMQVTDDFSDLGGQPLQAFYRMRYKP
jgi:hypothetical protein